MSKTIKFRATPVSAGVSSAQRTEKGKRVFTGVAVAQAVEALGHNIMLDVNTLYRLEVLGNMAKNGVKSRYTHPGLSTDGMGKFLGRLTDFRVDLSGQIPTVRADLHFADAASRSPEGDLAGYIFDLAEEDPNAFGMSVVIATELVWVTEDGQEINVWNEDDERVPRPENSLYEYPVSRPTELHAADVVDEPAATREGVFSAFSKTTNMLSAELFGKIDDALTYYGVSPARAYEFVMSYFVARGVDGNSYDLPHSVDRQGLRRLSTSPITILEDLQMDEAEVFIDEVEEAAVPAVPQLDSGLFDALVAQVVERVGLSAESNDDLTEIVGAINDLHIAVETLQNGIHVLSQQLAVQALAISGLQGEPVVTRKVTPMRREQQVAASVPNVPVPSQVPDYRKGTDGFSLTNDPLSNALAMSDLRHGGK